MATLYVFVTGPSGSGKSQLLYSLGEPDGFEVDEARGLELRHVRIEETLDVCVFCAREASRFDGLMEINPQELLGHIVTVDSADPDTWSTAQMMMANCRTYALLPTVIAANKQDLPDAHTAEQVGGALGMESMVSVRGCVATDAESAQSILLHLLYSVDREIDRLDALIAEIERLVAQGDDGSSARDLF